MSNKLTNYNEAIFDRRVEKRSLSGVKTRFFKEVYQKMAKPDGQFIFSHSKERLYADLGQTIYILINMVLNI